MFNPSFHQAVVLHPNIQQAIIRVRSFEIHTTGRKF